MPASIPSEPKCSLTSFPQCWHLISRTVHSVYVPLSSKMRRLHLGLGHLITSICRLLLYSTPANNWPYFPPPRIDMEQGKQPTSAGSLLSFVHYKCCNLIHHISIKSNWTNFFPFGNAFSFCAIFYIQYPPKPESVNLLPLDDELHQVYQIHECMVKRTPIRHLYLSE